MVLLRLSGKNSVTAKYLPSIHTMIISDIYDNFPFVKNFEPMDQKNCHEKFDKNQQSFPRCLQAWGSTIKQCSRGLHGKFDGRQHKRSFSRKIANLASRFLDNR